MANPRKSSLSGKDTPLLDLVFQRIEKSEEKSIPFSAFMELALYHPKWGYYSRPDSRVVGREGDFFTSVSVGETYGFLLSEKIRAERKQGFSSQGPFRIVEQGAHDGQLAVDIVTALLRLDPSELGEWEYCIVEPRATVREQLRKRFEKEEVLRAEEAEIRVVSSLPEASHPQGIFLCNELLDAFPFDRVAREDGQWGEKQVGIEDGELAWVTRPLRPELVPFVEALPRDLPDDYATEICPAVSSWIEEVAQVFESGTWWLIDYGFKADDYYASHRSTGTFRCYRDHQASEEPFEAVGETDITAHVDFSLVRRAAEKVGLNWSGLTDQHHFLTEAARPWLLSMEGQVPDEVVSKRLRQFQTLTHPGMMGKQFKIATLRRP
jgi:SAM-dependent MidA family methyltransferase